MDEDNKVTGVALQGGEPSMLWSEEKDRAYHDWLYGQGTFDRMNWYFTGYISFHRFGQMIAPYLEGCSRILDVGCGTAEITCYLAQKFPNKTFLCVDYSVPGLQWAEGNSRRLGLKNMSFQACNFYKDPPSGPFDMVLFQDSFHHFNDPKRMMEIVEGLSDRVLLMEPHGNELGQWVHQMDFDFVNPEIHRLRNEINRILKDEDPSQTIQTEGPAPAVYSHAAQGEATEYRYPPEFYEEALKNFDLEVRGTIGCIESYKENVYEKTESNALFNRMVADILESIDHRLAKSGMDIFAKHWLIYGEKKGRRQSTGRKFDGFARYRALYHQAIGAAQEESDDLSFYTVEYGHVEVPAAVKAGSAMSAWMHVFNRGTGTRSSLHPKYPVYISYHWLSESRGVVQFDCPRVQFSKPLGPNECVNVGLRVVAPPNPGRYILQLDMVRELKAWFSNKNQPPAERPVVVVA